MAPSVAAVVATSIQPRRRFTTNHRIVALLVIPLLAAGVAMMLSDYSNALYYPPWTFTVVFSPLAVLYSMTTRAVFHLRPSLFQSETTSIPIIPSSATALVNSHHHRRLALITGANTGIGYETAKALVQTHDVDVILACRSHDKATAAAALINQGRRRSEDDDARAIVLPNAVLDLQSPTSIREYVKELARLDYSAIDILINNAGRNTQPTDDDDSNKDDKRNGLFQANFLGHFQLTAELLERNLLRASVISSDDKTTLLPRIVNLSSVMHHFVGGGATGSIESADTWRKIMTTSGNNDNAYALSKLAMILFTRQLNIRYGDRLRVLAVNPGAVNSDIWRSFPSWTAHIFRLFYLTPEQGSTTSVAAAVGDLSEYKDLALYLQPYAIPSWLNYGNNLRKEDSDSDTTAISSMFPLWEILGPFGGAHASRPRLPRTDQGLAASKALWEASQQVSSSRWPPQ